MASRLRSGTVNVNEAYAAAWGSIDAPMGGMGDSGLGRRHGAVGITKFTESQTIARQRLMNLAPPLRLHPRPSRLRAQMPGCSDQGGDFRRRRGQAEQCLGVGGLDRRERRKGPAGDLVAGGIVLQEMAGHGFALFGLQPLRGPVPNNIALRVLQPADAP